FVIGVVQFGSFFIGWCFSCVVGVVQMVLLSLVGVLRRWWRPVWCFFSGWCIVGTVFLFH
ncbi:18693_t:CDS:1, partial [Dentiscutata erythropus]